jgi:hypothetical protein
MSRGYRVTHRKTVNPGEPNDCGISNNGYKPIKIIVFTFTGRYILCTEKADETYGDVKKALLPEIIPKILPNQRRKLLFFENPNNRPEDEFIGPKDEIPDHRKLPQEGPIEIQLLVEDALPPYYLTMESISVKSDKIMKDTRFYRRLMEVAEDAKEYYEHLIEYSKKTKEEKEIAIAEFDILEFYSIMSLLENNLIDYDHRTANIIMHLLYAFEGAVYSLDSHEIAVIIYNYEHLVKKVKVV